MPKTTRAQLIAAAVLRHVYAATRPEQHRRKDEGLLGKTDWHELYTFSVVDALRAMLRKEKAFEGNELDRLSVVPLLALLLNGTPLERRGPLALHLWKVIGGVNGLPTLASNANVDRLIREQRLLTLLAESREDEGERLELVRRLFERWRGTHANVERFYGEVAPRGGPFATQVLDLLIERWKGHAKRPLSNAKLCAELDTYGRIDARLLHVEASGFTREALDQSKAIRRKLFEARPRSAGGPSVELKLDSEAHALARLSRIVQWEILTTDATHDFVFDSGKDIYKAGSAEIGFDPSWTEQAEWAKASWEHLRKMHIGTPSLPIARSHPEKWRNVTETPRLDSARLLIREFQRLVGDKFNRHREQVLASHRIGDIDAWRDGLLTLWSALWLVRAAKAHSPDNPKPFRPDVSKDGGDSKNVSLDWQSCGYPEWGEFLGLWTADTSEQTLLLTPRWFSLWALWELDDAKLHLSALKLGPRARPDALADETAIANGEKFFKHLWKAPASSGATIDDPWDAAFVATLPVPLLPVEALFRSYSAACQNLLVFHGASLSVRAKQGSARVPKALAFVTVAGRMPDRASSAAPQGRAHDPWRQWLTPYEAFAHSMFAAVEIEQLARPKTAWDAFLGWLRSLVCSDCGNKWQREPLDSLLYNSFHECSACAQRAWRDLKLQQLSDGLFKGAVCPLLGVSGDRVFNSLSLVVLALWCARQFGRSLTTTVESPPPPHTPPSESWGERARVAYAHDWATKARLSHEAARAWLAAFERLVSVQLDQVPATKALVRWSEPCFTLILDGGVLAGVARAYPEAFLETAPGLGTRAAVSLAKAHVALLRLLPVNVAPTAQQLTVTL